MSSYYYLFKFIVIGDSGVGKSCLVLRFSENHIRKNHDVTIGVEFAVKILPINGKNIKLQIWDTAGQENFRSITRSYYRTAIGAVLVYDITKRDSFQHIASWIQEMKTNGNPHMVVCLVGNKNDRELHRQVRREEGQALADEHSFLFFETSAKDAINVEEAFTKLAEDITQRIDEGEIPLGGDNQAVKIGAEYSHFYQHKKSAERGSSSITRGSDNETMTLDGENKYGSRMGCC